MRITFLGAGSTVFVKNLLGDCILSENLKNFEIALHDIDEQRLDDSYQMLCGLNDKYKGGIKIYKFLNRKEALRGAKYVINAIQVGGYKPCTVTDFEVPKKYGLRQTIADTVGIGGIFRALRTIPVMEDFATDMEEVCPHAYFLNYVNPMAIITGYMLRYTKVNTIGLCHSVQRCAPDLLASLDMDEYKDTAIWECAGINHMSWLLKITDQDGNDLYPEIKRRVKLGIGKFRESDLVRMDIMQRFGYYNTESSEHTSEYHPYYIKSRYPELISKYKIPLDEYPRRCERHEVQWAELRKKLLNKETLEHTFSSEYGMYIIDAIENNKPYKLYGNVLNTGGLISNLPREACVEVPVIADANGFTPCYIGELPIQCAALNRTNINMQLMTIEAARQRKKELVYMAAYLDPHTASELSMDDIRNLCDDLFTAHGSWIPEYK